MLGAHHESLMVGVDDGVERGGGWLGRNGLAFHSVMNIFFSRQLNVNVNFNIYN